MKDIRQILDIVDRPHLPPPGAPGRSSFKEWFHFTLTDVQHHADIVANVSLSGDVTQAGMATADVIALCHRPSHGWSGSIDSYEAAAASLNAERLSLKLSGNRVEYVDGAYQLAIHLRDEEFSLTARLVPRASPMLIWNDTPIGSGHLNWLIVPALSASGRIALSDTAISFTDALAYHDHNWGQWKWGDDFGWEWGTLIAPAEDAGQTALVFDRTTDRDGGQVLEQTLGVWHNGTLAKLFTRQMIRARRFGRFEGQIPRLPGPARLIEWGQVLEIPREYRISARDDDDWIDIEYRIDGALQVSVPTDFGFGVVGLNETVGNCTVRGEFGRTAVEFVTRGCFEFMA
jgi:hypothetical protein